MHPSKSWRRISSDIIRVLTESNTAVLILSLRYPAFGIWPMKLYRYWLSQIPRYWYCHWDTRTLVSDDIILMIYDTLEDVTLHLMQCIIFLECRVFIFHSVCALIKLLFCAIYHMIYVTWTKVVIINLVVTHPSVTIVFEYLHIRPCICYLKISSSLSQIRDLSLMNKLVNGQISSGQLPTTVDPLRINTWSIISSSCIKYPLPLVWCMV